MNDRPDASSDTGHTTPFSLCTALQQQLHSLQDSVSALRDELGRGRGKCPCAESRPARPAQPDEESWAKELTLRETEVMQLLARGLSNRRIARQLTISEATVKHHLRSVFLKLGVEDRGQAIVKVLTTLSDAPSPPSSPPSPHPGRPDPQEPDLCGTPVRRLPAQPQPRNDP